MATALISVLTLVRPSAAVDFAVLQAETQSAPPRQFCMVYYPEFKVLPDSASLAIPLNLKNATRFDGCSELPVKYDNEATLTMATNLCPMETSVVNFKKAKSSALLMATSITKFDSSDVDINDTQRFDILVGYISDSTAKFLVDLLNQHSGDVKVRAFSSHQAAIDYSLLAIWVTAVFTVAVGAYWSGLVRLELFLCEQQSRYPCNPQDCGFMNGSNGFSDNKISNSGSLNGYNAALADAPPAEESSLKVSPLLVTLFVTCMSGMLILLYYFFQYLVYFIIGMFAIASVTSLIGVLEPLVERIPIGTTKIPRRLIPCYTGTIQIRHVVLVIFSVGVTTAWLVFRNMPWSWALQDVLGVAFSLNMLRTLRLPNLMICCVLLVMLFFYDIFFVFVTPFLTMKGESVMVEVARGVADTHEQLPMVLRIPHLSSEPLSVCYSQFSLLGFGDILVPGLLVSYCHAFDLLHHSKPTRLYYIVSLCCYGIGLLVTFVALYLMDTAQPALLYLVPCTLIPVVLISLCKGEFLAMWRGNFSLLSASNNQITSRVAADNVAPMLPPYGATETDPAPIYQTDPTVIPHN